jgi:hypothetical protein
MTLAALWFPGQRRCWPYRLGLSDSSGGATIPTTSWPCRFAALPARLSLWKGKLGMILALHADMIEADLQAGSLSCSCSGPLRPWSYARARLIRQRDGTHLELRARRAICTGCGRTHVLVPAVCLRSATGRQT